MVRDLYVLQICFVEPGPFQQSAQPSQVTSFSQSVHSIPQAPASYSVSKSPGKYNPPGQSAFSSYSSHYAQHQQKITDPFPAYQIQRMQQPGETCRGLQKLCQYYFCNESIVFSRQVRARLCCKKYKYWDRFIWVYSADPDQTVLEGVVLSGLHHLPLFLHLLDLLPYCKTILFHTKDK